MTFISAVVPVYHGKGSLRELHARLKVQLARISSSHEIIFVDDRGEDGSWSVVQALARKDRKVKGLRLSRNFGQHAATLCGIEQASGKWILTLDEDLEHLPESIPLLYREALKGGYDLVYGKYPIRFHSWWRNMTSRMARATLRRIIPNMNVDYTSFRLMTGRTAKALSRFDSPYPFIDGYLAWVTNHYGSVTVPHGVRHQGRSGYNFRKLAAHMMSIFYNFSEIPLRAVLWVGLLFFALGSLWIALILWWKLTGRDIAAGYTSLVALILAFGGIQFCVLGVLGEYLGRINFKTSRKPLYLVRETEGFGRKRPG